MTTWGEVSRAALPWWLRTGEGGAIKFTIDRMLGAMSQRLYDGLLARFPSYAPDDALPYLCRDRRVTRGINEPRASIVARLLRFLDDLRVIGSPFALHAELRAYLQADVMIRTVDRRGNFFTTAVGGAQSVALNTLVWDWDGGALSAWSRFWVIIYPADGVPWAASVGNVSGATWPAGGTIGTTATLDQVATVRQLVQEWSPAGTRCEWIIIAFDADTFGPTDPTAAGTYRNWGVADGADYVVARNTTARYWRGVPGT